MKRTLWIEYVFRPLVIGVMFGCIAISIVQVIHLIFPTWNATFLVVGCVLVAIEANYSYRLVQSRRMSFGEVLRFRVIEFAMFFLLLKAGSYVGDSWSGVIADIRSWPRNLYGIFDGETIAAFFLAFLAWHVSTQTAGDLERLDHPPRYYYIRGYVPPMQSLADRFFVGGVALLIFAGVARVGIASLLNLRSPPVPGLVLNVLAYFVLGLVMLSQVRFVTLYNRWQMQEISIAHDLPRRWIWYGLVFVGLAALIAFALPTGYTLGLLEVVGYGLGILMFVLLLLFRLLVFLLLLPLALLFSLLGVGPPTTVEQFELPQASNFAQRTGPAPHWLEGLRSLIFWAVALGILVYIVHGYLRDHPELGEVLLGFGPIRILHRLWTAIRRWLGGWARTVGEHMPRTLPRWLSRGRGSPRRAFNFFRLGGLSPRERVLYYYLSILRRAEQLGFPRWPDQTPNEYQATLEPRFPQTQQEISLLTQAFVEARYSQHAVDASRAKNVRSIWQRIKAEFQRIKHKRRKEKLSKDEHKPVED